jgi:hypothetical protein
MNFQSRSGNLVLNPLIGKVLLKNIQESRSEIITNLNPIVMLVIWQDFGFMAGILAEDASGIYLALKQLGQRKHQD